ncbi:MAG: radical SAM protein [Elusimicrobia bacterium]|nr:radical SAM protein [Elusimicrobiota bacterium]
MRGDEFFQTAAARPPFNRLHPRLAAFLKDYLSREKVVRFGGRFVVNTNFPPFPGRAFDRFAEGFLEAGGSARRRLHSVTLAVTNRCSYRCWHCYNAGRNQQDVPLARLRELARELGELGAVCVTLTGGEPLLRSDLEAIVSAFDDRFYLSLGTTGAGLTAARARGLKRRGLFAVGVSLDSADEAEHDRGRGRPGSFRTALSALRMCREAGLYSYVVAVASPGLLARGSFLPFLRFCKGAGAYEVHLLEPCPIGRLQGRCDAVLPAAAARRMLAYQAEVARDEDLPILSAYAYIESGRAFGCGAGLTHLYIDGSGEVCPCNFVPLSFGSMRARPLSAILSRMGRRFCRPRTSCVGRLLAPHLPEGPQPLMPAVSERLCARRLPARHALPRFFRVRAEAVSRAGSRELAAAYDAINSDYDDYWLREAGRPVAELVARLPWSGSERVFEAGCGTGYASRLIAERLDRGGKLLAADISRGMLARAARRLGTAPPGRVRFARGDALALLGERHGLDLVFSSWALGYIPLESFLASSFGALRGGGRLAFIVHRENSPRRELELFRRVGAEDPGSLDMKVDFDFPSPGRVRAGLRSAGLRLDELWTGKAVFRYGSASQVLEHLLKSGAGTAYYRAVKPRRRPRARRRFLELLAAANAGRPGYEVVHDYVGCVAQKP